MTLLDLTLPTPAENLALDEALLDAAEDGVGGEVLRFWESPTPFVVVGYANKIASEVNVAACEATGGPEPRTELEVLVRAAVMAHTNSSRSAPRRPWPDPLPESVTFAQLPGFLSGSDGSSSR